MTSEWRYNQPVEVTGGHLGGDDPYHRDLCIAPDGSPSALTCYDPDDARDGLVIERWDDSRLTFEPPADVPTSGVVVLKVRDSAEECFGSAGCADSLVDAQRQLGAYKAARSPPP